MDKKKRITILIIFIIVFILYTYNRYNSSQEKNILKKLEAKDISKITMQALPPDFRIELSTKERSQVITYLRQLKIRRVEEKKLTGQLIKFIITKKDNSKLTLGLIGNYAEFDGLYYEVDDVACDKLNAYANKMLKKKDKGIGP